MRRPVELRQAWKLINHGPTTLVTSAADGCRNVMAAAWVMGIDFDPPRLIAVLDGETWTSELVRRSGEFVVNLPCVAQLDLTLAVGKVSGRDVDKFARHAIATAPASQVGAPLVEGCVAWLECRRIPEPRIEEAYALHLAEVVAAWADDEVFQDGRWTFREESRRTIHHVASGVFFVTGEQRTARPPEG